jgi:hypothetical protein
MNKIGLLLSNRVLNYCDFVLSSVISVLIISVNIIILLPCGPSDFTFDYFGGVGRGRCGKDRLGDRCSVCTTGVGESDNCHVASLDNYDEHQINVEINSVVLKMACFGTWICATDIGWGLDVGGLILRFVLQLGKHANGLRTRWFFVEL